MKWFWIARNNDRWRWIKVGPSIHVHKYSRKETKTTLFKKNKWKKLHTSLFTVRVFLQCWNFQNLNSVQIQLEKSDYTKQCGSRIKSPVRRMESHFLHNTWSNIPYSIGQLWECVWTCILLPLALSLCHKKYII